MKIIDFLTEAKKPEPPKTRSPAAASLADRKFQQKIIPNKKKKIDPKHKKTVGMDETLDPGEYDMEGDSVKTNLHTIVRACKQLNSALADDQNLPEWVQDKVAQAKGMMVGVTEYMLSTGEREPGMNEARKSAWDKMASAVKKSTGKDLNKGDERAQDALKGLKQSAKDYQNIVDKDKKTNESTKQKGVDGKACWKGYKRMGTKKKGGKTVDNCVPTGK